MALVLVVRHRDDPNQTYNNQWAPAEERLESIRTNQTIANQCDASMNDGNQWIYFHRMAYGAANAVPQIFGRAKVAKIPVSLGGGVYSVTFEEWEAQNIQYNGQGIFGGSYVRDDLL